MSSNVNNNIKPTNSYFSTESKELELTPHEKFQQDAINTLAPMVSSIVLQVLPKNVESYEKGKNGEFTLKYKGQQKLEVEIDKGKGSCEFSDTIKGKMDKDALTLEQGSARYSVSLLSGSITQIKAAKDLNLEVIARVGLGIFKYGKTFTVSYMDAMQVIQDNQQKNKDSS